MSLALARKYRPKRFADVAVQSHVSATLQGAVARGRVAHGYLLCGPRGVGKTTLARVLAMALNCEPRRDAARALEQRARGGPRPTSEPVAGMTDDELARAASEPCGVCISCQRIWSGSASLDVVEIDAASNRGVDDARDLRERAMYAPSGDEGYKVYIVDEAHMLTREAWNALLKILEEPPPRVVFVFATTEPQKIAQTAAPVLSRLQRFDFKRIGPADLKDRLEHVLANEAVPADPDALAMIARAADGSMRDALSLTDQVLSTSEGRITASRVREALGLVPEDEFIGVLDLIADRRAAEVFTVVGRLADAGIDFGGFLTGLADMLRAQLAIVLGGLPNDVSEYARRALEERRARIGAADLLRMLGALSELEPRFRKSGQQQLLVETLLVRFALLDRAIELEDLLRSIGGGGGGGGSDRPTSDARRADAQRQASAVGAGSPGPVIVADRPIPREREAMVARAIVLADASPRPSGAAVLEPRGGSVGVALPRRPVLAPAVHLLAERWDELVDRLRLAGKTLLATAVHHSMPVTVTAGGDVTLELEEPNDIHEQAFEAGRADVLTVLGEWFSGVQRIHLRSPDRGVASPAPRRVTEEDIRTERLAALRKRDPLLDAAIDALDLEVAD